MALHQSIVDNIRLKRDFAETEQPVTEQAVVEAVKRTDARLTDDFAQDFMLNVRELTERLRNEFNARDLPDVMFSIDIRGRTTGDLKMEFVINAGQYGDVRVKGFDPRKILLEMLRRKGFDEVNTPLALTYGGDTKNSED